MENPSLSEVPLSSLLCDEIETEHYVGKGKEDFEGGGAMDSDSDSLVDDILMSCNNEWSDSDEEYIRLLLEREKKIDSHCLGQTQNESPHLLPYPGMFVDGDWKKAARLDSINYILNARALFGFQFQTAYLAVIYMDRFLSLTSINIEKSWTLQLLSIACLSLAAKLQEVKIPALSDIQLRGDPYFEGKTVQRMELLVLNVLKWKMGSQTPFAYLPYFISKIHNINNNGHPSRGIVTRILQLIIAILKDFNLIDHYPSAVGLSSVLITWDHSLTRKSLESKIYDIFPCSSSLDLEDVWNCYIIMQRLERDDHQVAQMPPSELLLALSSDLCTPTNLRRRDSPSIYSICSKRRRIEFSNSLSDPDQDEPPQQQQLGRET